MSLVKWGFIGLLVLPAAELATFLLVAALIGWLAAAMLFVATSVAGVMLLRHSGRDNLDRLIPDVFSPCSTGWRHSWSNRL